MSKKFYNTTDGITFQPEWQTVWSPMYRCSPVILLLRRSPKKYKKFPTS